MWAPFGWVAERIGSLVNTVRDAALDKVLDGLVGWVTDAFSMLIEQILNLVRDTATPNVLETIRHDRPLWNTTVGIAVVLLLGFVLAAIVQGLAAGDVSRAARRILFALPAAAIAMVALPTITQSMLAFTDEAVKGILASEEQHLEKIFTGLSVGSAIPGGGFITFVLGVIGVGAAIAVWLELYARAALIHVVVAVSPIAFATLVWPALRVVAKRLVYLLVSLVFCKLMIAIVIRVGAAVATSVDVSGDGIEQSIGRFITGMFILLLAAFAPYGLMRMLPFAEGALMAQGAAAVPTALAGGMASGLSLHGSMSGRDLSQLAGSSGGGGSGGGGGSSGGGGASGPAGGGSASGGAAAGGARTAAAGGSTGGAGAGASGGAAAAGAGATATGVGAAVGIPLLIASAGLQAGQSARRAASDAGAAAGASAPSGPGLAG